MKSKKIRFSASICILIISACTTVTPIVGPDGTENQLVKGPSIEACYEKAREVCGGPYKIVNSNSDSDKNGTIFDLLIKCGR